MNGRKRNDYYKRESEKSKGKSERSELRPPDTSTLSSSSTLPTLISQTSLNPTQIPTIYSTQNTILSTISTTFLLTLTRSSISAYFDTTQSTTITL